jgi:hypothetical protein
MVFNTSILLIFSQGSDGKVSKSSPEKNGINVMLMILNKLNFSFLVEQVVMSNMNLALETLI